MERRDFIKHTCAVCLAVSSGLLAFTLDSCASFPVFEAEMTGRKLKVPLSAFANGDLLVVSAASLLYDIGLLRHKDGSCTALLLRCTHADTQLIPEGNAFVCPAHGSRFDLQGHVLRGPAARALTVFPVEQARDAFIVTIDEKAL